MNIRAWSVQIVCRESPQRKALAIFDRLDLDLNTLAVLFEAPSLRRRQYPPNLPRQNGNALETLLLIGPGKETSPPALVGSSVTLTGDPEVLIDVPQTGRRRVGGGLRVVWIKT